MAINTDSLHAFLTTSETGSFTKAAVLLGLSQSALSQKIARLEDQIEASIFIRKPDGIALTAAGEKLLVFARQQLQLEEEFLSTFVSNKEALKGHLRIAAFSSVLRSLIIPRLAGWLRKNPGIRVDLSSHEVPELLEILRSNKADMIVTDYFPGIPGVEEIQIGTEEYVMIESTKHTKVPDVYLDNFSGDNATESFFKHQGMKFHGERAYMGDVYGIIDGVALGIGKAIMSKHLITNDPRFRILKSPKKYTRPIVLSFYRQAYYPKVQREAREELQEN